MNWYSAHLKLPTEDPQEEIFEVITAEHAEGYGYAVAKIVRSEAHYHLETVETYTLLKGSLRVFINNEPHELTEPGQSLEIPLCAVHHAEAIGDEPAVVGVHTIPAWTFEDHILI